VLIPGKPFCSRPKLESSVLEAATNQQRIVLLVERRSRLVKMTALRGKEFEHRTSGTAGAFIARLHGAGPMPCTSSHEEWSIGIRR